MITDHALITEREERTLRSWLDESPPMLPDRVWSAVMAEVPATRQRRPTVVTHALPDRRWARLLLAAALVTALAGGLIAGVGATGLVRLPGPPHALPRTGELDPGTYVVDAPSAATVASLRPSRSKVITVASVIVLLSAGWPWRTMLPSSSSPISRAKRRRCREASCSPAGFIARRFTQRHN